MSTTPKSSTNNNLQPLEIIEDLFHRIIGPLAATQVASILLEPDHIDERVNLLLQIFDRNPYLIVPFRNLIKALHATETEVTLEEQIRFYTTKHTRNWLIVNLLNKVLKTKDLQLDLDTGRLPAKPQDLIKNAYVASSAFGEESRYKDLAFSVGLIFDFLFYLQKTHYVELGSLKMDEPIAQAFARSVEQGKIIIQLSRHKSKLSLEKYAAITPFLRNLAPLCLTMLRPQTSADFYKKLSSIKSNEQLRLALEIQTFGVHSGMIAAYLGQSLKIFEHTGEAMSVWAFPYLTWVSGKRDIHDLAGMGELGCAVQERLKGPDFGASGHASSGLPDLKFLEFTFTPGVKNEVKI